MIYFINLQYCEECCKNTTCISGSVLDFFKEGLCYSWSILGDIIGILLFLCVIIINILFLVWIINQFRIWIKQNSKTPSKDAIIDQNNKPSSDISKSNRELKCVRIPNIPHDVVIGCANILLEKMGAAINNYKKDDTDDAQKNREMITFQECLFHLQNCKLNIESIRNIKIDEYLESLSECLNDMAERKYGNDPEKVNEAKEERERIAENFKQAKEGIEKSYK